GSSIGASCAAPGGRHRRIHQIAPIAMAAAATEARIHGSWSDTKPTSPPALGPSGGTGASASMYTVVPSSRNGVGFREVPGSSIHAPSPRGTIVTFPFDVAVPVAPAGRWMVTRE